MREIVGAALIAVVLWVMAGQVRYDCYVGHIAKACAEIEQKY